MKYSKIKSGRLGISILLLNGIIILIYITAYCGCTTTEVLTKSPDIQKPGFTREIKSIELLNGKEIDCEDKLMKIEKTSESTGIVIVQESDTIKAGSAGYKYKSDWNELRIPLNDIRNFQIYDNTETDVVSGTVIVISAVIIGLFITGVAIASSLSR